MMASSAVKGLFCDEKNIAVQTFKSTCQFLKPFFEPGPNPIKDIPA